MVFKIKKNSGVVGTESRESRSISLEETLELTLAEVKELRAEMTMLRRELLGDRFPEPSENDEVTDGLVENSPWGLNTIARKDVELYPQQQALSVAAQQAAARDDSPGQAKDLPKLEPEPEPEPEKVEGWATVNLRPSNKRRWWQFWKSKKTKSKQNSLYFA